MSGLQEILSLDNIRPRYGYSDIAHRMIQWGTGSATSPMCVVRLPLDDTPSPKRDVYVSGVAAAVRMERAG